MVNMSEFQKKIRQQENNRISDIYTECEKRGCTRRFLEQFDTRIWIFPKKQAQAFLKGRSNPVSDQDRLEENIRQFIIYLEVLIEKRPHHEKYAEWLKAIEVLENGKK